MIKFLNLKYWRYFVENRQNKTSDAKLKANKKYSNSRWRPNIYINMEYWEIIENWLIDNGYKSINDYVIKSLKDDGVIKD